MKVPFRIALICGVLPLTVGVAIFVLWLITRWDWLMEAGILTIYGGVVVVLVGVIALVLFWWLARRTPSSECRRLRPRIAACGFLLFLNFPVAAGVTIAAIAVFTSYKVVVHNEAQETLVNVVVVGGGCEESLGSIPPNARRVVTVWFKHAGVLKFRAESTTSSYEETVDGSVTPAIGGRATITVNQDGTVSVNRRTVVR